MVEMALQCPSQGLEVPLTTPTPVSVGELVTWPYLGEKGGGEAGRCGPWLDSCFQLQPCTGEGGRGSCLATSFFCLCAF